MRSTSGGSSAILWSGRTHLRLPSPYKAAICDAKLTKCRFAFFRSTSLYYLQNITSFWAPTAHRTLPLDPSGTEVPRSLTISLPKFWIPLCRHYTILHSYLEQSSSARYLGIVSATLQSTSEDPPFLIVLPVTVKC